VAQPSAEFNKELVGTGGSTEPLGPPGSCHGLHMSRSELSVIRGQQGQREVTAGIRHVLYPAGYGFVGCIIDEFNINIYLARYNVLAVKKIA